MAAHVEDLSVAPFDPKIHLNYTPPKKVFTLEDLKLKPLPSSSNIAATTPFPLLSEEGVLAYRRALFAKEVLDNCATNPYTNTIVLRNAAKYSKWLHDMWSHPETVRIVSEAMGTPLVPIFKLEEGFVSVQTKSTNFQDMMKEISIEPLVGKVELTEEEKNFNPLAASTIPWHFDSYPYACIVMLSNTENMIGGETYIKTGDGEIQKVEGPTMGCAYIIQGWMLEHIASRAFGAKERIASVTSFRQNKPGVYDVSYMSNTRGVTNLKDMYYEWAEYRLEVMRTNIEKMQVKLKGDGVVDPKEFGNLAKEHADYMTRTARQMVPYEYNKAVIDKFGLIEYGRASDKLWEEIQSHPEFQQRLLRVDSLQFPPALPYVGDLAETIAALDRGETIMGQCGLVQKPKNRPYCMGDELIRQGQKEVLLDWLGWSGLYELRALPQKEKAANWSSGRILLGGLSWHRIWSSLGLLLRL
ncbi:MAG: hypothetical protein M1834_004739 [Cirrosporium novae-zelandiae]|nr:MAG: hypothetical protein M1834_004739 [Cirrosporium novae-zelandiae]